MGVGLTAGVRNVGNAESYGATPGTVSFDSSVCIGFRCSETTVRALGSLESCYGHAQLSECLRTRGQAGVGH